MPPLLLLAPLDEELAPPPLEPDAEPLEALAVEPAPVPDALLVAPGSLPPPPAAVPVTAPPPCPAAPTPPPPTPSPFVPCAHAAASTPTSTTVVKAKPSLVTGPPPTWDCHRFRKRSGDVSRGRAAPGASASLDFEGAPGAFTRRCGAIRGRLRPPMTPLVAPEIEQYTHDHTTAPPPLFDEMRDVTYAQMSSPQMQVGRVEGALLKMLCTLAGARRVVEVGTFTGYSALSMAAALPDDGELITCDIDPEATRIARSFFDRSPHGRKITIRLGDALETINALPADPTLDLVFLDADKERYVAYYEALLPRLRRGGLVVADNTLWSGKVLSPSEATDRAIVAFNRRVAEDPRVENVLLSVRDGIMLARKL